MNLTELAKTINDEAVKMFGDKWADNDPIAMHMLMVSEIAEATEELRKGRPPIWYGADGKPEGEAVELADCMLRILHYCGLRRLDIQKAMDVKREYNAKRNWKGEGKRI